MSLAHCFRGALPLSDSPGRCRKMVIALIQKQRLSASVCLSVFGTEENGHIEPTSVPLQSSLGFTRGPFCQ